MRNRFMSVTAALLLATATSARAQDAAKAAQQPPPTVQPTAPGEEALPWGTIDFGYRGTATTGDDARYDRYSDLRDGAATRILINRQTDQFAFNANAFAVGYRDQQYAAKYTNGKATLFGSFNSIPLNYANTATSPWNMISTNSFALDPFTRAAVQNKVPGVVGVPQNAAQLNSTSAYRNLAQRVDLSTLRQTTQAGFNFDVDRNTAFNMAFTSTLRDGRQPWGASFAFNNANELPMAVDNRTSDVNANMEWTNARGMMKVGYNGSFFNNTVKELVWDNPIRATDTTPYDASGYSNGNGPAQGRMSMAPSNSMNMFTATGMYKLPAHSTFNGSLSYARMSQDDTLIPWTINPQIANAAVYQTFPGLARLPRSTAQAQVDAINGVLNFNSRPNRYVGFSARYRFNDHKNKTPMFDAVEYVRFDAVPEETGGETEPFDIRQNNLDLSATFNAIRYTSLKVSYIYDDYARTSRAFANLTDNGVRFSLDTVGNQFVTVRGIYEYSQRRGSGFEQAVITNGGAQDALRFYDDAERNHTRGTLLLMVNPAEVLDFSFSVAAGKDDYRIGAMQFGLQDNSSTAYNAGVNVNTPAGIVFGANYGRDRYAANQQSRNANPAPDPQWTDPTRNWTLNNVENVNNFTLFVDAPRVINRNTNVRVSYDLSNSDNGFNFGGPRIAQLAAIGQFIPLPNATNTWHRVTGDVQYFFSKKVGVGVGYWYEKLDVVDFNTINVPGTTTPRIDYLGEISTGYGNRPYTGNTAFLRLLYNF